jgi:surfactin synthase thioesterase subunit/glycosyltransferase involved in cell wall biosynthesis
MRILLAHNSLYYPSFGGGDKSNRLLMEALAARGHFVTVASRVEKFGRAEHEHVLEQLRHRGVVAEETADGIRFALNGVDVHTMTLSSHLRRFFAGLMEQVDPDVIITSTDDPAQLLFDVARRSKRARLVYLVRATIAAPFGPDSSLESRTKTEALASVDGIVGVSEYVAKYVRDYGGLPAIHVPISLMESGDTSILGRFENRYVSMVNPCAVKGIDIFLALADRMPQLEFAAIPTWGTTAEDIDALRKRFNITILEPVDRIDDLLAQSRVMLVPSVWAEARSRIVMEGMLRGIPVMASDTGGLREAKLGVPYVLPVNPVRHYESLLNHNMVPVAEVPPQDAGPWQDALERLTSDRAHWEEISAHSRDAALEYARHLTAEPFERFLLELLERPKRSTSATVSAAAALDAKRRQLLAVRLKQQARAKAAPLSPWFPAVTGPRSSGLRLFCFPHAGAGAAAFRDWIGRLSGVEVAPVLLPGREERAGEPPITEMGQLIEELGRAIEPFITGAYAFFGHSMGAGVAFELARALRRRGSPLPRLLIVSGARAPHLRGQVEIGDAPGSIVEALGADVRLFTLHRYAPEPPLDCPIAAYGGVSDANVGPEHLEGWREYTTAAFHRREFPGGHFYLQTSVDAVLQAVAEDLRIG